MCVKADMLLDLSDLSVLGMASPDPLNAIGLDVKKLARAATMSDDLSAALALANGEEGNEDRSRQSLHPPEAGR
jgi:hypothetical protein